MNTDQKQRLVVGCVRHRDELRRCARALCRRVFYALLLGEVTPKGKRFEVVDMSTSTANEAVADLNQGIDAAVTRFVDDMVIAHRNRDIC